MYARTLGLIALFSAAADATAAFGFDPYQTYAVGSWADAVAVGDVTGDGRDDVVMTTASYFDPVNDNSVFVFVQQAGGQLAAPQRYSYQSTANRTGLALGDLNRDGILDIVVGHGSGITTMTSTKLRGGRQFTIRVINGGQPSDDVAVVDVDRDGKLDVVGQSWSSSAIIFYGKGDGAIRSTSPLFTNAGGYNDLKAGDLNADGYPDLAVSSGQGRVDVLYHDKVSGYTAAPRVIDPGYSPWGVAIGDFNDDGRNDLATSKSSNSPTHVSLFLQQANGQPSAPTHLASYDSPGPMIGTDIDGNGKDDLLVLHDGWNALGYYLQDVSGLQQELLVPLPYASWYNTQGLAVGDINRDDCRDVVIANYNYGLVWLYGNGCQRSPDLVVGVGLTPTTAAIRLEHVSGTTQIEQPLVRIDLSVQSGSLQTGTLPADCVLQAQTATTRRIECLVASLAPGANTTLIIPLGVSPSDTNNTLRVHAQAQTNTPELSLANNRSWKRIVVAPATSQPLVKRRLRPQRLTRNIQP